jgi:hypothetical protein
VQARSLQGSIHLAPKDLRDFFCTEIAAKSDDAAVAMRLMRHASLATTTKYMRTVENRLREAVESIGCDSGCDSNVVPGREMSDPAKLEKMRELAKVLESYGFLKGNFGGGGRIRTADRGYEPRALTN